MERNGSLKEVMAGIRLVLEEIRDLRRDSREVLERIDRHQAQAAEDRRRSDERFERIHEEFRDHLEEIRQEAREDRKRFNRTMRIAIGVARGLRADVRENTAILRENTGILKENTGILKENTKLLQDNSKTLHDIARSMRIRGNGARGNGK